MSADFVQNAIALGVLFGAIGTAAVLLQRKEDRELADEERELRDVQKGGGGGSASSRRAIRQENLDKLHATYFKRLK